MNLQINNVEGSNVSQHRKKTKVIVLQVFNNLFSLHRALEDRILSGGTVICKSHKSSYIPPMVDLVKYLVPIISKVIERVDTSTLYQIANVL
jgi:hypothetical protein